MTPQMKQLGWCRYVCCIGVTRLPVVWTKHRDTQWGGEAGCERQTYTEHKAARMQSSALASPASHCHNVSDTLTHNKITYVMAPMPTPPTHPQPLHNAHSPGHIAPSRQAVAFSTRQQCFIMPPSHHHTIVVKITHWLYLYVTWRWVIGQSPYHTSIHM